MDEPCNVDTSVNGEIFADSFLNLFYHPYIPNYVQPLGRPHRWMQGSMHLPPVPLNRGHDAVSNGVGRMIESHDALGLLRQRLQPSTSHPACETAGKKNLSPKSRVKAISWNVHLVPGFSIRYYLLPREGSNLWLRTARLGIWSVVSDQLTLPDHPGLYAMGYS